MKFRDDMVYVLTCQAGFEALVRHEVTRLGLEIISTQDRMIRARGDERQGYELLLWSRFASRVYIELARANISSFDALFDLASHIHWRSVIPRDFSIITEAVSVRSILSHIPTLQSLTKKAIVNSLTQHADSHHLYENRSGKEVHIKTFCIENTGSILLDITGAPLHKRGYRQYAGDAPIKESLAAALIALAGWKYRAPLYDPFCGSGTLLIEAALMARNIAPGLLRTFCVQHQPWYTKELFETVRAHAKTRIYPSGNYTLFGSDIDPEMREISQKNARAAGVEKDIIFSQEDFFEQREKYKKTSDPLWIISNPPYGERMKSDDLDALYRALASTFSSQHIFGGIITSYQAWQNMIAKDLWKNRKLSNGSIVTRFWSKKDRTHTQ